MTGVRQGSTSVRVNAERPYEVRIGHGVLADLSNLLPEGARAAVIYPEPLRELGDRAAGLVGDAVRVEVPTGEAAKTPQVAARCWDRMAEAGLTRSDVVVGIGGGATTDLVGFVAATWLRGVPFISVPTTVLGMADAAVGGKTGIDIPAGKNLVGAFHEPIGVLCDLDLLETLPGREVISGLAEIIKCGFIRDTRIVSLVDADPADALHVGGDRFAELLVRAIRVKADTVSGDLREATSQGDRVGRESLNYGHTLAHAIEAHEHFRLRHGEAVAIGAVFAAEVAERLGLADPGLADVHRRVFASVGLPIGYRDASWSQLRPLMSLDKKSRGTTLRLIVVDRQPGSVRVVAGPDEGILEAAFDALRTEFS